MVTSETLINVRPEMVYCHSERSEESPATKKIRDSSSLSLLRMTRESLVTGWTLITDFLKIQLYHSPKLCLAWIPGVREENQKN
jgi:hypothetical protein